MKQGGDVNVYTENTVSKHERTWPYRTMIQMNRFENRKTRYEI